MTDDLTHAEAVERALAFRASVSDQAYVSVSLKLSRRASEAVGVTLYPRGLCHSGGMVINGNGASYREAFEIAEARWAEAEDLAATNTIRAMALRIITLTAEFGECTDAALRADFPARDVTRHADAAATLANDFAGNGPFSVVRLTGANDMGQAA